MTAAAQTQSEYRNLPLDSLIEASINPRRIFDEMALNELAESIRTQGVLSPLLVRPINPQTYEVVAGRRRYRAAQRCARTRREKEEEPKQATGRSEDV